jgi:serine/threonine protein phosphatase 1
VLSLSRWIGRLFGFVGKMSSQINLWNPSAMVVKPTLPLLTFPKPAIPICIIGDVHGMAGLLENLLKQIADQHIKAKPRVIFVGDLIDRGPDSAAVLARVMRLCRDDPAHYICVMGNHERMLLEALANPEARFGRWLAAGGMETCQSYGVQPQIYSRAKRHMPHAQTPVEWARSLQQNMGPDVLDWLQDLPVFWQEADLGVTHAGADPSLPLADHDHDHLIWGHPLFYRAPDMTQNTNRFWIAHGHVIVPEIDLAHSLVTGRIPTDTGAYRTGRLSAVWLDQNGARVIQSGATTA